MNVSNFIFLNVIAIFAAIVHASDGGSKMAAVAAVSVPQPVQTILRTYCYDCHNDKKSKGGVRLDTFSVLESNARLDLMNTLQEQLHFQEMPPEDKKQPNPTERKLLIEWVRDGLIQANAPLIEDKLRYPDYGNAVDHDKLFSGAITDKPFTPARRWLVSPQIFDERVLDIFKLEGKERENLRKSGFYGIANPFLLPEHSGVRDYDITSLEGGHLLVMLTNAEWISHKQIRAARVKKGELKADEIENKADKWYPKFTPPAFEAIILNESKPADDAITAAIQTQFACVLQRLASDKELEKYRELTRSAIVLGGNVEGLRQMLVAVLLESEFLNRLEFGAGTVDEYGRKKLSPREASYAISYALGDRSPDPALVKAAQDGRLNTKEDYQREVSRLLADENYYKGQIDKTLNGRLYESNVTARPRMVRFFRDFFGYPNALKVFKDKMRSDGYYDNPDRGTAGTPGRLVLEADLLVERMVTQDRNVFVNLLGADEYYVSPVDNAGEKIAALNKIYEIFKDTDWKKDPKKVAEDNLDSIKKYINPKADAKQLTEVMTHIAKFREKGLNPYPRWGYPGANSNATWVSSYNIEFLNWEYPQKQPFKVPNRKGILTHPAWLIAHSSNEHTDPIRRGRWIQEKLLAGRVPDVPITVDAVVPEGPHQTFRERVESVTEQSACWNCHQKMNPLGYPFERYDDFGRYRAEEPLESPENLIQKAKVKGGADIFKTKLVNTKGNLLGTGDIKLDGQIKDAFDLIDRLAKSDKVRQSIIRHAFRFFMGRNEMLSDSQTLIDADQAYVKSDGSFKAVIVSLLTSDSFMYRK